MRAVVVALILLAPGTAALAIPPLGEYPADWACDPDGRVCAGIGVGGTVACALLANATASCDYSYGYISRAWSGNAESGDETHTFHALVEICSSVSGCQTLLEEEPSMECAWLTVLWCEDAGSRAGEHATPVLAWGECVTLWFHSDATIGAAVHGQLAPVLLDTASAAYAHASHDGAQVCRVDDGR